MTQIIAPNTTKPNHKKNNAIRKWQNLMDKTNEKHMSKLIIKKINCMVGGKSLFSFSLLFYSSSDIKYI